MRIATNLMAVMAVGLMLTATDAIAKDNVYRWVDDKGVVHFGDLPPGQSDSEVVDLSQSATSGVKIISDPVENTGPLTEAEPSLAQQRREQRTENFREARERKEAVAAGCEQRRGILEQLEPSTRVIVQGEDGEVYRLDDNVRMKSVNEAKAYIAENCTE